MRLLLILLGIPTGHHAEKMVKERDVTGGTACDWSLVCGEDE